MADKRSSHVCTVITVSIDLRPFCLGNCFLLCRVWATIVLRDIGWGFCHVDHYKIEPRPAVSLSIMSVPSPTFSASSTFSDMDSTDGIGLSDPATAQHRRAMLDLVNRLRNTG